MPMKAVVLKKGTRLVCPLCRKTIGEIAKDLRERDMVMPEHLTIYGKEVKVGDKLICPDCEFPYGAVTQVGGVIHTERGWLPESAGGPWVGPSLEAYLREQKRWRREWNNLRDNLVKDFGQRTREEREAEKA